MTCDKCGGDLVIIAYTTTGLSIYMCTVCKQKVLELVEYIVVSDEFVDSCCVPSEMEVQ